MKPTAIAWNILLAGLGLYGVFVRWGPLVYQQAKFQFTDPRGDSAMWPATVAGFLFLLAFVACLFALSSLFNRRLGTTARIAAGALTLLLLLGWVTSAALWPSLGIPETLVQRMLRFEGVPFLVVALASFGIAGCAGSGPLYLGARWLQRISARKE